MRDGQELFDDNEVQHTTTEGVSPEAPASAPARDEHGRFAPQDKGETEAAPAVEEGAPPAPEKSQPARDIPITALLDEREKRQRAEARLAMLERQLQSQQPEPALPDVMEDPDGYTRAIHQRTAVEMHNRSLQMARALAVREYGAETVEAAYAYFDQPQNRHHTHMFAREPLSFHAMVEAYKAQKAAEERAAPDYEAKLRAQIEAELMAKYAPQQAQTVAPSTRNAPPSLASAGATGREPAPTADHPLFS